MKDALKRLIENALHTAGPASEQLRLAQAAQKELEGLGNVAKIQEDNHALLLKAGRRRAQRDEALTRLSRLVEASKGLRASLEGWDYEVKVSIGTAIALLNLGARSAEGTALLDDPAETE